MIECQGILSEQTHTRRLTVGFPDLDLHPFPGTAWPLRRVNAVWQMIWSSAMTLVIVS
jgi:hypothetical protein